MAERFTTRLAVFVIIRNERGEILLQQRTNTTYLDGYWDFPSGHVEHGESLQEAAARELHEEVGLVVRPEDLRLVHIDQYFLDKDYINFVLVADRWQGTPAIGEPEKVGDLRFFAPDTLPEKCVNVVRVYERAGFSDDLTYSTTTKDSYEAIMGEPFPYM